jgi:pyridoxine/pyridoxamine 5'-phosphate oxidase
MSTFEAKTQIVSTFLHQQKLAVVSSIWEGKPQSAVVVISIKNDSEVLFNTPKTSRKYRNLKANPNTSLVIGWNEGITVQFEGVAEEVPSDEFEEYQKIHLTKNPEVAQYAHLEGQCYFRIIPNWIRYADPKLNFELTF